MTIHLVVMTTDLVVMTIELVVMTIELVVMTVESSHDCEGGVKCASGVNHPPASAVGD